MTVRILFQVVDFFFVFLCFPAVVVFFPRPCPLLPMIVQRESTVNVSFQEDPLPVRTSSVLCTQRIQYMHLDHHTNVFDLIDMEINGINHHIPPDAINPTLYTVMTRYGFKRRTRTHVTRHQPYFVQKALVNTPLSYMLGQTLPQTVLNVIEARERPWVAFLDKAFTTMMMQRLAPTYPLIFAQSYVNRLAGIVKNIPTLARSLHRMVLTAPPSDFKTQAQNLIEHTHEHLDSLIGTAQPDTCTRLTMCLYHSAKNSDAMRHRAVSRPRPPNADQVVQQLWSHQ
ncbi:hypothetical protein BC940DRAFT_369621 [Gongronella butleri]|nr:hypothetical protein BC940DRAFT_369621 [Gongronella butleri]